MNNSAVQAGISFISDRSSFWRLVKFYTVIVLFPFTLLQAVALTRLGDIVFGEWVGASAAVISEAKTASAILTLWIFPILERNIAFSLAFIQKRTILITYATVVRLLALFVFLFIYPFWLKGAAIGSAALVSCMATEAVFMAVVTYPFFQNFRETTEPRCLIWICGGFLGIFVVVSRDAFGSSLNIRHRGDRVDPAGCHCGCGRRGFVVARFERHRNRHCRHEQRLFGGISGARPAALYPV